MENAVIFTFLAGENLSKKPTEAPLPQTAPEGPNENTAPSTPHRSRRACSPTAVVEPSRSRRSLCPSPREPGHNTERSRKVPRALQDPGSRAEHMQESRGGRGISYPLGEVEGSNPQGPEAAQHGEQGQAQVVPRRKH